MAGARVLSLTALIVALAAAGLWAEQRSIFPLTQTPGKPTTAGGMLGDAAVDVLKNPTRVTVYRVEPGDGDFFAGRNVEGFKVTAEKQVTEADKVAWLRDGVILETKHYDFSQWGENKWCGAFSPGVAMVFERGQAKVIALVCFKCNDVVYCVYDAKAERTLSTFVDFRPGRAKFLEASKWAFPDDKVLAELKAE
jgi:hypothetical protein